MPVREKEADETRGQEEKDRRRLFCFFLARLGNPLEAAVRAGYPAGKAAHHAAKLLEEKRVLALTARYARLEREERIWGQAVQGLRRLAFGSVNDGAALAMSGEENPDISRLDLFGVAEIKRPKGGGCEIKFYDRLAALTALARIGGEESGDRGMGSLYGALEESARALRGGEPRVL